MTAILGGAQQQVNETKQFLIVQLERQSGNREGEEGGGPLGGELPSVEDITELQRVKFSMKGGAVSNNELH